eukprot:Sspe_Gene.50632::Locus_28170_Transcript_1_1_Confidence_1.000_Length_4288::g.50632::m.50632
MSAPGEPPPGKQQSVDTDDGVEDLPDDTVLLRKRISELRDFNTVLLGKLETSDARSQKLELQLKRISGGSDVSELQSLDTVIKAKAEAEAKLQELQVRLDRTIQQGEQQEKDLRECNKRNQTLAEENQTYLQETRQHAAKSRKLEHDLEAERQRATTLQHERDMAQKSLSTHKERADKLQAKLDACEKESKTTIANLREEKNALQEALSAAKRSEAAKIEQLKQTAADLESKEDARDAEIARLKDDLACATSKLLHHENMLRRAESTAAEKQALVDSLREETEELKAFIQKTREEDAETTERLMQQIDTLTEGRNAAEKEVVQLRNQLNSVHPLIGMDGDEGKSGKSVPFSFADIVCMKERVASMEGQIAQLQRMNKELAKHNNTLSQERTQHRQKIDRLATQIIEMQRQLRVVQQERDEAVEWKDKNQALVDLAEDAAKTNDLLSLQIQSLLYETVPEEAGDLAVTTVYRNTCELQQRNVQLHSLIESQKRAHAREMAEVKARMEEEFMVRINEAKGHLEEVVKEREEARKAHMESTERVQRLTASLEQFRHYKAILQSETSAVSPVPSGLAHNLIQSPGASKQDIAATRDIQRLTEELAAAQTQVEELQSECLELQRQRNTLEASRQHACALHEAAMRNEKQAISERDHYREQAELASRSADEMLRKLLESQGKLAEKERALMVRDAQLEGRSKEADHLRQTNSSMLQTAGKMEELVAKVTGVQRFMAEQSDSKLEKLRAERDEAREQLNAKEKELQEERMTFRAHKKKHEEETTEAQAQLATTREQLANVTKQLELEKEQLKQEKLLKQRLAADLERVDAERKVLKYSNPGESMDFLADRTDEVIVQELQAKLEGEVKEHEASKKIIQDLKEAIRGLDELSQTAQQQLKAKEQLEKQLTSELTQLKEEKKSKLEDWARREEQLKKREHDLAKREEEQKAKIAALEQRAAALQKELEDGKQERIDATEGWKKAVEDATMWRTKYEDAVFAKGEMVKRIQALEKKVKVEDQSPQAEPLKDPAEVEALKEELVRRRSECENLHALLAGMEPSKAIEQDHLTAVLDAMRSRNKELEEKLRIEEKEAKVLRAQNDQLRRQANASKQTGPDPVSMLERRVLNLKNQISELEERENKLREELAVKTTQLDQWRAAANENKQLKEDAKKMQAHIHQLEASLLATSSEKDATEGRLHALQQEQEMQKAEQQKKDTEIKDLKESLEKTSKERQDWKRKAEHEERERKFKERTIADLRRRESTRESAAEAGSPGAAAETGVAMKRTASSAFNPPEKLRRVDSGSGGPATAASTPFSLEPQSPVPPTAIPKDPSSGTESPPKVNPFATDSRPKTAPTAARRKWEPSTGSSVFGKQ